MIPRDRVLKALNRKKPDKVPYMEIGVDEILGRRLLNKNTPLDKSGMPPIDGFDPWFGFVGDNYYTPIELCEFLHMDCWGMSVQPEKFSVLEEAQTMTGERSYRTGAQIKCKEDLKKIKLAKLKDNKIFEYINDYLKKYKKDYATCAITCYGFDRYCIIWDGKVSPTHWQTITGL